LIQRHNVTLGDQTTNAFNQQPNFGSDQQQQLQSQSPQFNQQPTFVQQSPFGQQPVVVDQQPQFGKQRHAATLRI
jgi:hypothetical protein